MPLTQALRHATRCVSVEDFAILMESSAHLGLISSGEVDDVWDDLPSRLRKALGRIDHRAESGTETRVRRYLERRGVSVLPQAQLPGVGRVDLLVGERLIIECDSREFHTGELAYQRDRRRDLLAVHAGYRVVRLTWRDVMIDWQTVAPLVLDLVRRGYHRDPGRRRTQRGA